MKNPSKALARIKHGVVIGIIILLVLLILPLFFPAKGPWRPAPQRQARNDMAGLVMAIEGYYNVYGTFPVSAAAQQAAGTGDFTYGATLPAPANPMPIGTLVNGQVIPNAEVIAILMDITNYPGNPAQLTANTNHLYNRQQIKFLNAKCVTDTATPGVGPDLVYRDPWGTPYFITIDLNHDGQCDDAFYGQKNISQQDGIKGYNGLSNTSDAGGTGNHFQSECRVMVWSAGPDKKIDPTAPASQGANKDNVISWQ